MNRNQLANSIQDYLEDNYGVEVEVSFREDVIVILPYQMPAIRLFDDHISVWDVVNSCTPVKMEYNEFTKSNLDLALMFASPNWQNRSV